MSLSKNEGSVLPVTQLTRPSIVKAEAATWEFQQISNSAPEGVEIVRVPIPSDLKSLTPLQKAIVMKSTKAWKDYDIPFLIYVQLWCAERGINEMSGDAYAVDGRLSVSDDIKIRRMRESGKVEWVRVSDPIEAKHPLSGAKDFYCEATIKHKDETEPQTYKAWFSEWNNPANANWQKRPVEALQRKSLARLSNRMFPFVDDEDFIPATPPVLTETEAILRAELLGAPTPAALPPASAAEEVFVLDKSLTGTKDPILSKPIKK